MRHFDHPNSQMIMLKHYFKISWRNILSSKGFSFINIFGLSTGLTAFVLIMLYVVDEMSYDQHHVHGENIYRVSIQGSTDKWVSTSPLVSQGLQDDFPEVERSTRLLRLPGSNQVLLSEDTKKTIFFETNGYYVDSTFFDVFTYDFKYGSGKGLYQPSSIVLSETVASKLFADEDPIGKVVKVGLSFGEFNYTVGGVFKDRGLKSHIPAHFFLSMKNKDLWEWVKNQKSWLYNNIFHTYIKLNESSNAQVFEAKIKNYIEEKAGDAYAASGMEKTLFLQHLPNIYLHSNYGYEIAPNGSITYLYIFTSIALFILMIACINFMNLSTARSEKRAKEVGMRKVIGAHKGSLIRQFLVESLMMSFLSVVVSILLIHLALPVFNQLIGRQLSLMSSPGFVSYLMVLTLMTGVVSGLYPALYLSSFKPITVLKGRLKNSFSAIAIRKGLVIFQFTISVVLILGAIFIGQQMTFLTNQNLGFDHQQKIVFPLQTEESVNNAETFMKEVLSRSEVEIATICGSYPGIESITDMLFYAEEHDPTDIIDVQTTYIEADYLETLGIHLLNGRSYSKEFTADSNAIVLNEEAVKQFGYSVENAVGKKIYYNMSNAGEPKAMHIIGVVKDYHYRSLHEKIEPMGLVNTRWFGGPNRFLIAKVKTQDYQSFVVDLQDKWQKMNPNSPFEWSFLDEDFQANYYREKLTLSLIRYFTMIAIVIACLGLFGLATFSAEQRTKEIGIRKVLGAEVSQIVILLSRDFVKLVLIAILIATPIAYYALSEWLEGFAYRITMQWWVFALGGISAITIAVLTVIFQAVRSAFANPVESLRSE